MSISIHNVIDVKVKKHVNMDLFEYVTIEFETENGTVEIHFYGNVSELLKIKSKEQENEKINYGDYVNGKSYRG